MFVRSTSHVVCQHFQFTVLKKKMHTFNIMFLSSLHAEWMYQNHAFQGLSPFFLRGDRKQKKIKRVRRIKRKKEKHEWFVGLPCRPVHVSSYIFLRLRSCKHQVWVLVLRGGVGDGKTREQGSRWLESKTRGKGLLTSDCYSRKYLTAERRHIHI